MKRAPESSSGVDCKYGVRAITDKDVLPQTNLGGENDRILGSYDCQTVLRDFYRRYRYAHHIRDDLTPEPLIVGGFALESATAWVGGLFVEQANNTVKPGDGGLVGIACLAPRLSGTNGRGRFPGFIHRGRGIQAPSSGITLECFRIMPKHQVAANLLLKETLALLPPELQKLSVGDHPEERSYTADLRAISV